MAPVPSVIGSYTSTLQIELAPSDSGEVHPRDLIRPFETLEFLCSNAAAVGSAAEDWGEEPLESRAKRLCPVVVSAQYGSPMLAVLGLPEIIAAHVSAMGLLICGLKYVWGLDLELRSHREEQRARFYAAREEALRAKDQLEELEGTLDLHGEGSIHYLAWREAAEGRRKEEFLKEELAEELDNLNQKFEALSRDLGWDSETAFKLTRRRKTEQWRGEEAIWSLDDE